MTSQEQRALSISSDDGTLKAMFDNAGAVQSVYKTGLGEFVRHSCEDGWRLILRTTAEYDIPVLAGDQQPSAIDNDGTALTLTYSTVSCRLGKLAIRVRVKISIDDGEFRWRMWVDNDADVEVVEAWCPLVGDLADVSSNPSEQWLTWPSAAGIRISDPRHNLLRYHSGYFGSDQVEVVAKLPYPTPASMSWFDFYSAEKGLYLACQDESFRNGALIALVAGDALTLGYVKYPFISKGESWESPVYVLMPHEGDWRCGAKRYRSWAEASWWRAPEPPEWIRTWLGWQRTILEHQYGEVLWSYAQLRDLYESAEAAGIDTLHVLGWWRGGMDNQYPNYVVDDRLGGETQLRDAISDVQASGGKLIFYSNGHIIDLATPFYDETGKRISAKSVEGAPYIERYNFWGRGAMLSVAGHKQFAVACPSCPEWWDLVEDTVRQVMELGADGLLIDQIGGVAGYLCFDKDHPHARPDEAFASARNGALRELRARIKADQPQFVLASENLTDVLNQHFDFIHGCGAGVQPAPESYPNLYRYTFPEYIITNRNGAYDETDYLAHMNFAFVYGLRYDMSVYRCRGSMADLPNTSAYFQRIKALHEATHYIILRGEYTDHDNYSLDSEKIVHAGYIDDDGRLAVAMWNPTDQSVACPMPETSLALENVRTLNGQTTPNGMELGPQEIAIWIFS